MDCTEQEPAGSARLPTAGTHAGWSALYSVARALPAAALPGWASAGRESIDRRGLRSPHPTRALSTTTHRQHTAYPPSYCLGGWDGAAYDGLSVPRWRMCRSAARFPV